MTKDTKGKKIEKIEIKEEARNYSKMSSRNLWDIIIVADKVNEIIDKLNEE